GYGSRTREESCDRAKGPIGTYDLFCTDKQSLGRALALRNLDSYLDRLASRLTAAGLSDWSEAVDLAIDEFVTMKRTVPGFGAVDFGRSEERRVGKGGRGRGGRDS